jgi:hypothetical protein
LCENDVEVIDPKTVSRDVDLELIGPCGKRASWSVGAAYEVAPSLQCKAIAVGN